MTPARHRLMFIRRVRPRSIVPAAAFAALSLLPVHRAAAQQAIVGYAPASATRERQVETDAIARPSPQSAATHSRELSREVHVAGTPAQARTRDYVVAQMKAWGLDTEVRAYDIWMPHPTEVLVWRVAPDTMRLTLSEPAVAGDPTSALPQYPTVNGYSGQGDVSGDVLYVNYGLIEDYAHLDSIGVSVKGKIVIARYGRSFRGIKAREAERHGAPGTPAFARGRDGGAVISSVDAPERPDRVQAPGSVEGSQPVEIAVVSQG